MLFVDRFDPCSKKWDWVSPGLTIRGGASWDGPIHFAINPTMQRESSCLFLFPCQIQAMDQVAISLMGFRYQDDGTGVRN